MRDRKQELLLKQERLNYWKLAEDISFNNFNRGDY
jgi:hypothetical protein